MKKLFVLTLLIIFVALPAFAEDWNEYESGRNNIRLDGYQGQPGYIAFTDGDGNVKGYLYLQESADELYFVTDDAFNTSYRLGVYTTGCTTNVGMPVSDYTGNASPGI